jgi:probable addiction module antidote protein
MRSRSHDDAMSEYYRNHPDYAVAMLNDILGDETATPGELLIALRQMARAFGGVQAVAEKSELNTTQMYRTLSAQGNPSLSSLAAILKAMGMRLAVKAVGGPDTLTSVVPKKSQRLRKKPARARSRMPSKVTAARSFRATNPHPD